MTDRDLFKPYKSLFPKKNQNKDMTPYTNPLYNLHSPSIQKKSCSSINTNRLYLYYVNELFKG